MALWPTCPARGLPDTVERSSRKFQLQESYKVFLSTLPFQSESILKKEKNQHPALQLDLPLEMDFFTNNDNNFTASPRMTPRSLST